MLQVDLREIPEIRERVHFCTSVCDVSSSSDINASVSDVYIVQCKPTDPDCSAQTGMENLTEDLLVTRPHC